MNQSSPFWGQEAAQRGAKLLVTPEDGITGVRGNQRVAWLKKWANTPRSSGVSLEFVSSF